MFTIFASCVEKINVVLSSLFNFCIKFRIWSPFSESRFAVGSSARMIGHFDINARAIATRCLCPPLNSLGLCFFQFVSPTVSIKKSVHSVNSFFDIFSFAGVEPMVSGRQMFS